MAADRTADTNSVRFILDGQTVTASDVEPTTTVLDYLRNQLGRTGTKEGCAEGDCGACTVVIGELRKNGRGIDYRAVNSCIRYLPTIDGHELVTVESLQATDGALHPVQQSLVDHHASQCGFCTPGFVMSLFALYLNNAAAGRTQVAEALAGNLCRCTGYRPIIDAGCAQSNYPEPSRWSRDDSQSARHIDALRNIQRKESLSTAGFSAPHTLIELANLLSEAPDSLILAGGTDIGLWTTKQLRDLPPIIYIGGVSELRDVSVSEGSLRIGAAVSLTDAFTAIVQHYPALADVARRFASPPVCNAGTLCGNIANGSPIGDSMPPLIALGARIQLRSGPRTRELPLEDFYLDYQRKDLHPGEFVVSVTVPLPSESQCLACYKVSKRFDQDISAVCGAFLVELEGDRIRTARIGFGGVAATPIRATQTEVALTGNAWSPSTIDNAATILGNEFTPLTDMRASADYRRTIAGNLLRRFFMEEAGTLRKVREGATS